MTNPVTRAVVAAVASELPLSETPRRPAAHIAVSERYVQAIGRAGARMILLPATPSTADCPPEELLSGVDGLCLLGGGDLDPASYGQTTHPLTHGVNQSRDAIELGLTRYAIANDIPLLAICRGCQVLNVACGGTLHQHLGDVPGFDEQSHGKPAELLTGIHPITATQGSRLAAAIGGVKALDCVSAHHQCADRVGAGLHVTAHAPDGCVEALELGDNHPFALGVQWHPEINAGIDSQQQGLFDAFVDAASKRRESLALSLA